MHCWSWPPEHLWDWSQSSSTTTPGREGTIQECWMVMSIWVVQAESWACLPQVPTPLIHKEMPGYLLAPPRKVICWEKNTENPSVFIVQVTFNLGRWGTMWGIGIPCCKPDFGSNLQDRKWRSTSRHEFGITTMNPTTFWCHQYRHITRTLVPRDVMAAKGVIPLNQLAEKDALRSFRHELRNSHWFSAS